MKRLGLLLAFLLALGAASGPGASAAVSLLQVGTFAQPVYVTAPAGDAERLFVVQKQGKVIVVNNGVASTFLDLTAKVRSTGNEQGLLSIAFAADYATSGEFYVFYTAPPPGGAGAGSDLTVEAYKRTDADHGDPASARPLLTIPHRINENHNGGQLQVGPDGMLWIGTGDGGGGNDTLGNAQKTDPSWNDAAAGHDARLGKLLRIDPKTGVAAAGNPGFAQSEIWAYGLRNPWRYSFDRATGNLVIGDVGQETWEEVDFAPGPDRGKGYNYGWNTYEGNHPRGTSDPAGAAAGFAWPILEKAHAAPDSFSSIAGGYVVRDPALPDLANRYIYADTYRGDIRAVTLAPGGAAGDAATGLHVNTLASFGEDACGRVYAVSLDGPVYRLAQSGDCILSTPGGGTTTPTPPSGGGATGGAPKLTLRAASKQRPWKTGVVRFTASCDAVCSISARGTFLITRTKSGAGAAAVKLLRTATAKTTLAAGARVSVKLKVSAKTRRSLLHALKRNRRVTLRFAVTTTGRDGKAATTTARSQITRR
ncbi:PQQ-dependent sugar dehydrogenase [Baekduia sp. Peel2402]|uniref:PQQ-dependent sugar dehydrogenase n=1 Tax=Baekduia sp. Peel2402 TaxID=3458296 RepID=UPI00403EEE25